VVPPGHDPPEIAAPPPLPPTSVLIVGAIAPEIVTDVAATNRRTQVSAVFRPRNVTAAASERAS
jgi:hypothetical protein